MNVVVDWGTAIASRERIGVDRACLDAIAAGVGELAQSGRPDRIDLSRIATLLMVSAGPFECSDIIEVELPILRIATRAVRAEFERSMADFECGDSDEPPCGATLHYLQIAEGLLSADR